MSAPSSRKMLSVQMLRGVAILLVLFFHLTEAEKRYFGLDIGGNFAAFGNAGVDIFFAISGFVVVGVARELEHCGVRGFFNFAYDRAARIYPIYWIYCIALIVPFLIDPRLVNSLARMDGIPDYLRSFLLLPNRTPPVLLVGWTLVFEVYFYAVLSLMLLLRIPVLVGLTLWLAALLLCNLRWRDVDASQFPVLALISSPLSLEFIGGGFASYAIFRRLGTHTAAWLLGAAVVLAGVLCATTPLPREDIDPWFRALRYGPIGVIALIALVSLEKRVHAPFLRWLATIGDASYSTYLTHTLVLSAIGRLFATQGSLGRAAGGAFALVGLCLLLGHWSYRYLELPLMHQLKRLKPATWRRVAASAP